MLALIFLFFASTLAANTHEFHWKTGLANRNVDGLKERPVITCNGEFPWPDVRVKRGDRVIVHLENGFDDWNTTLHFHGMFQNGTSQMDGPEMVTQCPIAPGDTMIYNFTVEDNKGTFWYHSHTPGQYQDGMKGLFIIEDEDFPYKYDDELSLQLSEWYHDISMDIIPSFLNVYNPTGAEPIPQNLIINNTMNLTWNVKPDTTYLLRIVNTGGFVSQFFWIEDHEMEVVEVDGVFVEKKKAEKLYITTAQRYSVLLHTKNDTSRNYAIMQRFDETMLDLIPSNLQLNTTSQMVYNSEAKKAEPVTTQSDLDFFDDMTLTPVGEDRKKAFGDPDQQIVVSVAMDNLKNGVNYAFFNNITYREPKVPTLMTALSAGDLATNPLVYGSNTHSYVLEKGQVVEIVINNDDTGRHPFHLHGHVFQVIGRGAPPTNDPDELDAADTIEYDEETAKENIAEYPMTRDTVFVNGKSWLAIRFIADNPGVWFFHCHIEWHMMQGLSLTLIEDPEGLQKKEQLTESSIRVCKNRGIDPFGNAAGNRQNFLDLKGENVQEKTIPPGFTAKGIVAMFFSCLVAIIGLITIAIYGLIEIPNMEEKVVEDLGVDTKIIDEGRSNTSSDGKSRDQL